MLIKLKSNYNNKNLLPLRFFCRKMQNVGTFLGGGELAWLI